MKILFITDQPIPNGLAATNRLLSLAAGVKGNNIDTEIIVFNPTEKNGLIENNNTKGNHKGVSFTYLSETTVLPSGRFKKFLIYFYCLTHIIPQLKRIHSKSGIDAIIISHTWSVYPLWIYYFFAKAKKIVFIQERNEYPFLNKNKNILRRIDYFIYTNLVLQCFDGLLVISKNLQKYYSQFLNKKALIEVIPMTVEPDRFGNNERDRNLKYIAYCGTLGGNKDGVYDLIKAFSIVSNEFNDYFLYIIGESKNKEELNSLKNLAKELKIEDKVIFTGKVSRNNMPSLLDKSTLLALARPKSIQAEGGFPTKLGEYLATGNPVVVTKVGEIPDYLTDGIHAYLANPDDPEDFAIKMKMALNDPKGAEKIGKKGKELVYSVFNYNEQGKNIISFINKIKDDRFNKVDFPG
jgi:glycosyltransferase involved in cell wall biosynthesis